MTDLILGLMALAGYNLEAICNWSEASFRALKRLTVNILKLSVTLFVVALVCWILFGGPYLLLLIIGAIYVILVGVMMCSVRALHAGGLLVGTDVVTNSLLALIDKQIEAEKSEGGGKPTFNIKPAPEGTDTNIEFVAVKTWLYGLQYVLMAFLIAIEYMMLVDFSFGSIELILSGLMAGVVWLIRRRPLKFNFWSWWGSTHGYIFLGVHAYLIATGFDHPFPKLAGWTFFILTFVVANHELGWLKKRKGPSDNYYFPFTAICFAVILLPVLFRDFSATIPGGVHGFPGWWASFTSLVEANVGPVVYTAMAAANNYGLYIAGLCAVGLLIAFFMMNRVGAIIAGVSLVTLILLGTHKLAWEMRDPTEDGINVIKQVSGTMINEGLKKSQKEIEPVMAKVKSHTSIRAEERGALKSISTPLRERIVNEQEAILDAKGLLRGRFRLRASHQPSADGKTGNVRSEAMSWLLTTPICHPTVITIQGTSKWELNGWDDEKPNEPKLNREMNAQGSVEDPIGWAKSRKVVRNAPFMAVLVMLGEDHDRVKWNWVPVYDPDPTKLSDDWLKMLVTPNGCESLRFVVNGYLTDSAGWNRGDAAGRPVKWFKHHGGEFTIDVQEAQNTSAP